MAKISALAVPQREPGAVAAQREVACRRHGVIAARAEALGQPFEELRARYEREIPLRRFVRANEVAAAALFIASDAASGITGQSFCVSGGIEV